MSYYAKVEISSLSSAVLEGEKYLLKIFLAKSSYIVIEPGRKELNQLLALSFSKNGNSLSLMASLDTLLCLKRVTEF